jgi:hypothetical protein
MNNKVLIKLIVPEIDETFDIFIPVGEVVWRIKELMLKSINSLLDIDLPTDANYILLNKGTARIYQNNDVIYDTDIRNATELLLLSTKD